MGRVLSRGLLKSLSLTMIYLLSLFSGRGVTFPLVALDIIFICLLVFGFGISGILLSWQRELSFFLFHGLNSPLSAIFLFETIFVEEGWC